MSNFDDYLTPSPDDSPIFMGEFSRGLDSKGRITLPATFREALGEDSAYLTRGLDGCLFLFPSKQFLELRQKLRSLPFTQEKSRRLRRLIFSGAAPIKPDGQGRVNLPPYLRDYAHLTDTVVVTGNDSHMEIWNAERWAEMCQQFQESADHAEAWDALNI